MKSDSKTKKLKKNLAVFITTNVPVIEEDKKVSDIETLFLKNIETYHSINYAYVVNKKGLLKGVVSIKEFFRGKKTKKVKEFLTTPPICAFEHTPPEKVAFLAIKHRLKAIPIINKSKKFLGVVGTEEIFKILDSEALENLLRFGGVMYSKTQDDIFHLPLLKSLKHRLPWLLLGLLGGLFASGVVQSFEGVLSQNVYLAAFIPLIVYLSDAVGTQMEAFIIRDLSHQEKFSFIKYLGRQLSIVLIISVILSALFYLGSVFIYHNSTIGLVVSISLFLATLSSLITGLIIPYAFSKLKLDPANASGPVATILQDIISVFIYFTVATLIISNP